MSRRSSEPAQEPTSSGACTPRRSRSSASRSSSPRRRSKAYNGRLVGYPRRSAGARAGGPLVFRMRTTLKRGIGRGAAVDGNGRPVLPPAALTPMTLYRQPEPPRRTGLQLVGRILLWLLVAVLVVAAGLLGGAYLYFHEQVKAVQAHDPALIQAERGLELTEAGKPATALIVGYDHRAGPESSLPSRSDTVMLVRADPIDKTVSLLSFPRDLIVPIHCPGRSVTLDRINAAYELCKTTGTLETLKEQVSQSFSLDKLPKLIHAVTSNVQVGQSGNRAVSGRTIASYALFLYRLPSGHFFQPKIENLQPAGPYNAELSAPPGAVEQAVGEFKNPDVEAPGQATAQALGTKFRSSAPRPRQISLVVLNGNGQPGSAANASFELAKRHYRVIVPPDPADRNAPSYDHAHTIVYYDAKKPLGAQAARRVANLFGDAEIATIPRALRPQQFKALLIVVVGDSFHGTFAAPAADQTPKKQPPAVAENPGATVPLLRSVRRRVPFRLQYPRLIEKTSSPDPADPIRSYWIANGHKAVRLVFRTGTIGDYWGIEETDWQDAPVLQEPNYTHRIKGREYDFYYAGPHLHMVVLHDHGATYWVTNTLLDALSNETMLAIAKSLTPLRK